MTVEIWLDLNINGGDLVGSQHQRWRSYWISTSTIEILLDLVEIWADLCLRERGRPVELVGLNFSCEDPPTDLLVSIPGLGDLLPIVVDV